MEVMEKTEVLPLPVFDKVRFDRWGLTEMTAGRESSAATFSAHEGENGIEINGQSVNYHYLSDELKKAGVLIMHIGDAKLRYPELVDRVLGRVINPSSDQLVADNFVQYNTGAFIYVPKNIRLTEPLHLYLNHLANEQDTVAHVLVYLEQNSELTLLAESQTVGVNGGKVSLLSEVVAGPGSKLTYVNFDDFDQNTTAYLNRQAKVGQGAVVDWVNASFSDGQTLNQLTSTLLGEGAQSDVKVASFTNGRQTQGFNTEVKNVGRHTVGHIFQRGVILDSANLIFNGLGKIIKGSKGSDAQQESRVLMLSRRGRGEANPLLLIDESDVTAGHAASVGQVDDQQLYYLMSRGLPEVLARRLVVRGFVGEVLAAIPDQRLLDRVVAAIERKLNDENGTQ
ncbi:Fe-S cluster assembly ABC-type transport system, permease component [Fructobacillus pseudoficulneus]|uniref:Fe-S cluster assembly ABC-type transport system, permease component n=1 Tax=Fructobacillus pseudoficulneus TaxID=220714 RepID=A0A3F3GVX5_9LACO|nr:Fe-S cluster assembly protein SufD [Fructobacillus pseudoficulneus]GAP02447.1 Fe-S cluster assembly ABC-type transport system, permease component [Fructobacillus pseudoficulneus]SEH36951.1 Fe-S cluster assembly protein SufD [Fructobacillus pseudoficulneus]